MSSRSTPTLGYPSRRDAIQALHEKGVSNQDIETAIGVSGNVVRAVLSQQRHGRKVRSERSIALPEAILEDLQPHAERRRISTNELARQLLQHIADEDSLVDAILDDR